ncbi:MAG: outer membrane protein assembly factor BamA [Acidobacteriota bacterium]
MTSSSWPFIIVASCVAIALCPSASAQENSPVEQVEEIRIVGNRRIPESTIRYYLQSKEGDVYNEVQVLQDYRKLLNADFFENLTVKKMRGDTGVIIIFEAVERPIIREISYQGMTSFKQSDVLERFRDMKVGLSVDSPFDPAKLPKARRAIKMLLDQSGRPLGRVGARVEEITSAAVRLIFEIEEGPKVRIGDLNFEGNTLLSDDQLRDALKLTKERNPISLFKGHDKYIEEKLEYDVQTNLMEKYRERGYLYARAGEPNVEIVAGPRGWLVGFRKTRHQYHITVPIQEGEQYRWGNFKLEGVKNFDQARIQDFYKIAPGEVVNYVAFKKANEDLKKLYSGFGYLEMEAIPEMDVSQEKGTVDVRLRVEEGKQYIVHRINFAGNTKTRDKVLRREFFLEEQQRFNAELFDFSILRLNQLGFFDKIEEKDYEVIKRPLQGEVDLLVKVKERSQQSIGLTGGTSGIYGAFIGVNYQSNNFRGKGQRVEVSLQTGTRTANYTFSFTEPYLLDTRTSIGFSVFNQRYRTDTYSMYYGYVSPGDNVALYTQRINGFSVSAGRPLWRWWKAGLSYQWQTIKITDINESFHDYAINQLLGFTPGGSDEDATNGILKSTVTPSLIYSTKDSYWGARRGTQLSLSFPISGGVLGGTYSVVQPTIDYQYFLPDRFLSGGRNTLAFRTQFMHLLPFGKLPDGGPMTVPFYERIFYGGEYNVRGFDYRAVSPWATTRTPKVDDAGRPLIDPVTGRPAITESAIPVGGDTSALFTTEYRIPIAGPLQLSAFFDLGSSMVLNTDNLRLFGPDTFIDLQEDTNAVWRASTGAEMQFMLPMINQPFRLIFAYNPMILNSEIMVDGVRFPLKEPRHSVKFSVGYSF